jgi:hypothetical protein
MQTNTFSKVLTGTVIAGMMLSSGAYASTIIGSGTVEGSGGLATDITWNDTFPGTATGTVNGLLVTGQVSPILNMTISGSGTIGLGKLAPTAYSSGSVNVEIGTNAANGASVTARSTNGGLKNLSNPTHIINNQSVDEVPDSYTFSSVINATEDSAFNAFAQSANPAPVEVSDTTTSHPIYTSDKPQSVTGVDDFTFTVAAKPDIQTPAGNYNDVVVITVTGNF